MGLFVQVSILLRSDGGQGNSTFWGCCGGLYKCTSVQGGHVQDRILRVLPTLSVYASLHGRKRC